MGARLLLFGFLIYCLAGLVACGVQKDKRLLTDTLTHARNVASTKSSYLGRGAAELKGNGLEALLISHEMGCRRASIVFGTQLEVEKVISECHKLRLQLLSEINSYNRE